MSTHATASVDAWIDPLTGIEDWPSWKVQMEDLLYNLELWEYVVEEGKPAITNPSAPTDAEKAALEEWRKKDRRALAAIRTRVSKPIVYQILSCSSSHDAWKRLEKNFEPQRSLVHVVEMRRKLGGTRYADYDDVEEFLGDMLRMRTSLAFLGRDLDEEAFSTYLLSALPDSWEAWSSSIAYTTRLLDSDAIIVWIRQQAICDTETGMRARQKRRGPPACYTCGEPGYARDCPNHDKKSKGKGQQA